MFVITGGSGSGKSALAEEILCQKVPGTKIYLATMTCRDAESQKRIFAHRKKRAGKGFVTVEKGVSVDAIQEKADGCLLECLGNLVANEMYSSASQRKDKSDADIVAGITADILKLSERFSEMGIVGNDVGRDIKADPETERYKRILGGVLKRLKDEADLVIEAVYGIPVLHKGELHESV